MCLNLVTVRLWLKHLTMTLIKDTYLDLSVTWSEKALITRQRQFKGRHLLEKYMVNSGTVPCPK